MCEAKYRGVSTGHEPLTGFKTPPKGREICFVTNRKPQASSRLKTTNHKRRNVTTSHKLRATSWFSRFPGRGWLCQPRRGVHAVSNAEPRVTYNQWPTTGHELQATGHPVTITTHHVLRTTYHATAEADTPVRHYDETSHEPQLQATGHKPLAALSRLPGRGRTRRPRSGAHAEREAEALPPPKRSKLERRGRLKPSPASKGPEAEQGASMTCNPQTTSYEPRTTSHRLAQNEILTVGRTVTITTYHALHTTSRREQTCYAPLFFFARP